MAEQDGKLICPHCGAENAASPLITICSSCFGALDTAPPAAASQSDQSPAPEPQPAVWTPPKTPPSPQAPPPLPQTPRPEAPAGQAQPPLGWLPPARKWPEPIPSSEPAERTSNWRTGTPSWWLTSQALGLRFWILIVVVTLHLLGRLVGTLHVPPSPSESPRPTLIESSLPPLHNAARTGDLQGAKRLLGQGLPVDQRDSLGRTPLHLAAWNGQLAVAKLLIERGAKVDAIANSGETPLRYAMVRGKPDIAKLLRDHGAKR